MVLRRTWAAALVVLVTVTASCGSDGPSRLSEDDFLDQLVDVCGTTQDSFDDLDEPADLGDVKNTAKDSISILEDAQKALAEIVPPENYARDFKKFMSLVDDEIAAFTDLRTAAADGDQPGAQAAYDDLTKLLAKQAAIADDLDSDDCSGVGAGPADPTVDPTVDPTGIPPTESTVAASVVTIAPPPTPALPTTTLPTTTAATPTIAVITTVAPTIPESTAPTSSGSILSESVTGSFDPPAGYTMVDTTSDITTDILTGMGTVPELTAAVDSVGVADLIEPGGVTVARILISFTNDENVQMPAAWTEYFCASGISVTTPGGFTGTECSNTAVTPEQRFFTLAGGQAGFSVISVDPNLDLGGLVDAFFQANPGE